MAHFKRLTAEDLYGRSAISYLRFSSSPQEKGTSIERQQETLDRIVAHYKLVLDRTLTDRALSASKGHHRTKGQLADLLTAIERGVIRPGTVLTVEAMDRLCREGIFDVFDLLRKLIVTGGMVLVTGNLTMWDEAAINSEMNHKLIAEINAARAYAERLSEFATGAHARRRRSMEALADDPTAPTVQLNSNPPGWLLRDGKTGYKINSIHAATIQTIFDLCIQGYSVRQIASELNKRGVAAIPFGKHPATEWRAPRIGTILRDYAVLGFVQPCKRVGSKRVSVGRRVKIYPQIIDDATWMRVREALDARRDNLRGRRGRGVPNLFTSHLYCKTCGGSMRVDTGGRIWRGRRRRQLICARYAESGTCSDTTRYDLHYYERFILHFLMVHAAPRTTTDSDERKILDQLSTVKITMSELSLSISTLSRRTGSNETLAEEVEKLTLELGAHRKVATELEIKLAAASTPVPRVGEVIEFFKSHVGLALNDNEDAREKLRTLLSRFDYRVTGNPDGGMIVTVSEVKYLIPPGRVGDSSYIGFELLKDGSLEPSLIPSAEDHRRITVCDLPGGAEPLKTAEDVLSALKSGRRVGVS